MRRSDVVLTNGIDLSPGPSGIDKWLLQRILKTIGPAPLRFVIEGGPALFPANISPVATVVIRDRRILWELIVDPEIAFSEGFAAGRIEVIGDLVRALEVVYEAWPNGAAARSWYARLTSSGMKLLQANSVDGSRQNIHRHYDLGNDFYKLWLDADLVYTCAYFESPDATLEEAQIAKMDYICRKLELRRGDTVIEAGCGWGALALYMARNYGLRVKAYNISHEQIVYARERAIEKGLDGQVEFIEDDYRNIAASDGADVFVSVGMLEHVGLSHFAELGEVIYRAVGDSGRGLLHFIGRSYKGDFSRWIRKRIFPGAYAPTLTEAMSLLEPRHFAVMDIENLRPHYAKTLEHWLERFEKSSRQVSENYDPWFERAWRLYLAGSIAGFRTGTLQLFQIAFAGSKREPVSDTRARLYRENQRCIPTMS